MELILIWVESTDEVDVCSVFWVELVLFLATDKESVQEWTNNVVITPITNVAINLTISIHWEGVIFIIIKVLKGWSKANEKQLKSANLLTIIMNKVVC